MLYYKYKIRKAIEAKGVNYENIKQSGSKERV